MPSAASGARAAKHRQAAAQSDDLAARPTFGRIRPAADALVELEKHRHDLTDVTPVARIIGLDEERTALDQAALDQGKKLRRDEPPLDLSGIVERLRMIAVNLGDAGGFDVALQQLPPAANGEPQVGQAALVAAPGGIADDNRQDIKAQVISDQSVFIKAAVENIKKHLIEGSFFAAIIIFLFLANIRTTLIAAIAIPTSIISTFALMAAMGFTLNQITMLALTLMVGIVIDDAIIVLENVYRFIEEKNMPPFQAAIQGTKEIGLAVLATTLSLLAVFVPVGFMGGIVGRFMSSFGLTAAFAVAVSMLVSFTLTPMLSARFIKPPDHSRGGSKESWFFSKIDHVYSTMLRWSMAN